MKRIVPVLGMLLAASITVRAQTWLDHVSFGSSDKSGLAIYGASIFSGFSRYDQPIQSLGTGRNSVNYGATGSVGWQLNKAGVNGSALYSGTYGGVGKDLGLSSYGHTLSLGLTGKLTPRLTGTLSASGQDNSLLQYFYQPLGLAVLSALPRTFDDLAAALGVGNFSSAQIQAITTQQGTAFLVSPIRSGLLGNRIRSYGASGQLNYAYSQRISFTGGANISGGYRVGGPFAENFVTPRTISGNVGVSWSKPLSARTEIGLAVNGYAGQSRFQHYYGQSATGSFGRKMGTHWLLNLSGGATRTTFTQQLFPGARTLQGTAAGSLAFQFRAQTLIGQYNLSASDANNFAIGTSTSISGAWNWQRIGNPWGLFANYSRQKQSNTGFIGLNGYQGAAGTNVRLSREISASVQYVYVNSTSQYVNSANGFAGHSVRASLGWSPQARR